MMKRRTQQFIFYSIVILSITLVAMGCGKPEEGVRAITYAIQYTDYTQTDPKEVLNSDQAKSLFQDFEWDKHLNKYLEIQKQNRDACPPNICFTDMTNRLWITADPQNRYLVMSNVQMKRKLLFIPFGTYYKDIERTHVSDDEVIMLIEAYFAGKFDIIKLFLTQGKTMAN